jgi:tripartite-type tricarboxylate transporter receptor subunit TctC
MSNTKTLRILCVVASVIVGKLFSAAPALSQTPYYAGKTIAIIRGGGPGGSGEFQSRALMPYLQKYIPGNPTIVMEYMPGAGGRKAANYFYTAKPDGLKIASAGAMIPGPILGLPGSNYDIDKFPYIGSTETGNPYILSPGWVRASTISIKCGAPRHCASGLTQSGTRFM